MKVKTTQLFIEHLPSQIIQRMHRTDTTTTPLLKAKHAQAYTFEPFESMGMAVGRDSCAMRVNKKSQYYSTERKLSICR